MLIPPESIFFSDVKPKYFNEDFTIYNEAKYDGVSSRPPIISKFLLIKNVRIMNTCSVVK